jgi:hypothetical protein
MVPPPRGGDEAGQEGHSGGRVMKAKRKIAFANVGAVS